MKKFTESVVEDAALAWFQDIGYSIVLGPEIAPEEPSAERSSFEEVVLKGRFEHALQRLNPNVPSAAIEEAFRKVTRISSPIQVDANHEFHHYLVNGVAVEYLRKDGSDNTGGENRKESGMIGWNHKNADAAHKDGTGTPSTVGR